jgi:hypothetical protein
MDEKGIMMGFIGKVRVIVSKHDKKIYMTQPGNREWVSLIECISLDGRLTRPWVIFKAKQHQKAWFSAFPEVHIGLSDNGWTDNEIGLEWLKKCFEPETRCGDEYRLLILDGHASHISTKAIKFCVASKIIPLCLPPHTTHLLQPLDVGIFAALATAYKAGVRERSKFIVSYSIDKIDFLEIYGSAREKAITPLNIEKAWKAVGLEPLDPEVVLKQLPARPSVNRPITPPSTVTYTGPTGEAIHVPITPANVAQVEELFKRIVECEPQLDPETLLKLQKLSKGASKAIANAFIQRTTNVDLITAELTKKKRSNRKNEQNYAYGRVLNKETIQEREDYCKLQEVWKDLARVQPNLLGPCAKAPVPQVLADNEGPACERALSGRTVTTAAKRAPVAKTTLATKAAPAGKRSTTCSQCGQQGHNRRTCRSQPTDNLQS